MGSAATALMPRFGQFLLSRGLVTSEQLDDALGHQAVQGARIGTNLVELGGLVIDDLAQALSDFHKVPLPPREWLEKPQRAATQRVTRALVERIRFVPMRLEGKVLHAALLDPRHPSVLDDLRFATGFRIQPYVLPEIWMHDWLLELFNVPRGIRHVELREHAEPPAPRPGPELNAHRPDAPPNYETTAMTNALSAAAAAVADARRMARNRPRPDAQKGPARTAPQARPAADSQRTAAGPQPSAQPQRAAAGPKPASQPQRAAAPPQPVAQPQRASAPQPASQPQRAASAPLPAAAPPAARAQHAERTPAPSPQPTSKSPPPPPAASVRPPSMRVRAHAPLSAIEAESWKLPPRVSTPPPLPQGALRSASPPPPSPSSEAERAPSPVPFAPEPAHSIAAAIASVRGAPAAAVVSALAPHSQDAQEGPAPVVAALAPDAEDAPAPVVAALAASASDSPDPPAPAPAADATTPALEPTAPSRELAHFERALAQVTDRDRLIEVVFSIATRLATRVALFSVHQGMIQGVRQVELGVARPVEGVLLPLDAPSMLSEAAKAAEPTRADPALREADQRVRELLQDAAATEVGLFPVAIKHRVVNVLYASNGGEPLGPIAFGALTLLAQEMALAYGRLILMRKTGGG